MLKYVALAAGLLLSFPSFAQDSSQCGPRDEILKELGDRYHEAPSAVGLTGDGKVLVELLVAADGATWTLLASKPNGVSCVIGDGTDWTSVTPTPTGPEA